MSEQAYMSVGKDANGKLLVTVVVPEYNKVVVIGWDKKYRCPSTTSDVIEMTGPNKGVLRWERVKD